MRQTEREFSIMFFSLGICVGVIIMFGVSLTPPLRAYFSPKPAPVDIVTHVKCEAAPKRCPEFHIPEQCLCL